MTKKFSKRATKAPNSETISRTKTASASDRPSASYSTVGAKTESAANLQESGWRAETADRRGPDFLPFEAEFKPAEQKRFQETVIFVHQFGGNKSSLTRHAKMVNDLGFDAILFNLMFSKINPSRSFPITAELKFGIRHVWSEQIEAILNSTPGRKILFSFSMPSNSVLMALAHRRAKDVAGWIADGGPFVQVPSCVWNLYEHHYAIKSKIIRGALTGASLLFYGPGFEKEAASLMRTLPRNFRILSFRGLQDPMVPPEAIDEVLIGANIEVKTEKSKPLKETARVLVETHTFEEGTHLDGLKNYGEAYIDHCETFLKEIAKPM